MKGRTPAALLRGKAQKIAAIRRTQAKTLKSSYKSHKLTSEKGAVARAGIWAAGSLFLDDLEKMLLSQEAKIGIFWGKPDTEMVSLATLYFHKEDGNHEVAQILLQGGRYPQPQEPGEITKRMNTLLDLHGVEIGLRWSHGIPVVQITDRLSKADLVLVVLEGIYGKRVLFQGQ